MSEFCALFMKRSGILFFILLFSLPGFSQAFRLTGKVTDSRLQPLGFVSIQTRQSNVGTNSKEDGSFELVLESGEYDIVFSMTGFKPQIIKLAVTRDYTQNVIMELDDAKTMDDIVIRTRIKDRWEELMRNVIRHKDSLVSASGPYSARVYIKAVQHDSTSRKRPTDTAGEDLSRMALAEISLKLDHGAAGQIKEERIGVQKRGNANSLFYLSTTQGEFNFYENLVAMPGLSEIPILSPISYTGLVAYKFKTIKTEKVNGHRLYTISVRGRQMSNATVEGELVVNDSDFSISRLRFVLPSYHLPEYDFFQIEQDFELVGGKAWMVRNQKFTYFNKSNKGRISGQTTVRFTNYELNKEFPPRHFGLEISATAQSAYEQDSSFWETARTEPLTAQEIRYIQYKDSVFRATHTKEYLDSVDAANNRITWKKIGFLGQTLYDRDKDRTWVFPPVWSMYNPFQFGGARFSPNVFYYRTYPDKKTLRLFLNPSYGFRNHDVNGSMQIDKRYNPFNRGLLTLAAGREFEFIYQGDAWINLLKRSNFYLNNHVSVGNDIELFNGFYLFTDAEMSFRRSVAGYKTNSNVDSLFGSVLDNNEPVYFDPYNAFYTKVKFSYTFKQPYVREPKEKIILQSKYPTVSVLWRRGIPGLFKSVVDFDYLEFSLNQQLNLGLVGVTRYSFKTGSFLSQKDLRLVDYTFQRRGDPLLFMNPDEAFQALDSTFPTFRRFYQVHGIHEFNGFLVNRIPFLKKLQLREIAGGGMLYAAERNLTYAELFAGVERVFKSPFNPLGKFKLGVYAVGSVANQFKNPVMFKVGLTTWNIRRNKWN